MIFIQHSDGRLGLHHGFKLYTNRWVHIIDHDMVLVKMGITFLIFLQVEENIVICASVT